MAAGVAGWQVWLVALSLRGRPWDPAFHAFKLSLLGVVVAVDLAAAYVLLRARPSPAWREGADGVAGVGRAPSTAAPASRKRVGIGLMLLGEAAVLSLITLPWLASTGE